MQYLTVLELNSQTAHDHHFKQFLLVLACFLALYISSRFRECRYCEQCAVSPIDFAIPAYKEDSRVNKGVQSVSLALSQVFSLTAAAQHRTC